MARLCDICDPAAVEQAIAGGLVSVRSEGRLSILNYTARAAYSRSWNEATLACRGLILDDDRVVARPFPKFFGPSEPDAPCIPAESGMQVTEKLDGSLGIVYPHPDGGVRVATRGSLTSEQAVEATSIWHEKYRHVAIPEGLTPLVEIIYPANRVVVDYGGTRDLGLIALIDNETGADVDTTRLGWPGPQAETVAFSSFAALVDHMSEAAGELSEGYVARFASNGTGPHTRFKLKFPAYTAAHRAIFRLNSARVWEAAACEAAFRMGLPAKEAAGALRLSPERVAGLLGREAGPVEGLRAALPEELLPWYDAAVAEASAAADERIRLYEALSRRADDEADDGSDRAFAAAAQRLAAGSGVHPGPMFSLRRGRKNARLAIWRQTKPSVQLAAEMLTADAAAASADVSRAVGGRTP